MRLLNYSAGIFLCLIFFFGCEKTEEDLTLPTTETTTQKQSPFVEQNPSVKAKVLSAISYFDAVIKEKPSLEVAVKAYEDYYVTNKIKSDGSFERDFQNDISSNSEAATIYNLLSRENFVSSEEIQILEEIQKHVTSSARLKESNLLREVINNLDELAPTSVISKMIHMMGTEGDGRNQETLISRAKTHECNDCRDDCLAFYRYSSEWYYYYYDQYNFCYTYGSSYDCSSEAKLFADANMMALYCEDACDDACQPEPCTTCPIAWTYDGANCYSGVHYPSGYVGFTLNGGLYTEPNCSISTSNQCCPPGFAFDGANCYYQGKTYPTSYTPFIYNRSFYVEPLCN